MAVTLPRRSTAAPGLTGSGLGRICEDHVLVDRGSRAGLRRRTTACVRTSGVSATTSGEALVRQEGAELLDLVEEVRRLVRVDPACRRAAPRGRRPAHRDPAGAGVLDVLPPGQRHRAGAPRPGSVGRSGGQGRPARRRSAGTSRGPIESGALSAEGVRPGGRPARRPAGVHRPPHRGGAPLGPRSSSAGSPTCSTSPTTARRPTDASPRSSTCSGRPTSCAATGRRCSTRPATPSTTSTSWPAGRWARSSTSSADVLRDLGRRARPRGAAVLVRQLDRRRPRRQPVREPPR